MMLFVPKSTSINLRITPQFRAEIEQLAAYHGLSMSSYAHSILVKGVRRERHELEGILPNASQSEPIVNGTIEPVSGQRTVHVRSIGELTDERKRKPIKRKVAK